MLILSQTTAPWRRIQTSKCLIQVLPDNFSWSALSLVLPWRACSPNDPLLHCLPQEVRRNTEVEAALLLAHRFDGGVLPLPALLAPVKRTLLARWGRRYLPGVAADPAALVAKLRSRLAAEPPLAGRFC